jgi:radical SAM protein
MSFYHLEGYEEMLRYDETPMLVYWETTRACDLACKHCRAEAVHHRSPFELTTDDAKDLLSEIARFSSQRSPHLVLTGGDPLRRPDLFEIMEYARQLGITFSVTPAGTIRLTSKVIEDLKSAGISSLALSLDGSSDERHDKFRGVSGSFDWTRRAAIAARELQIPLQINTMVTAETLDDLPAIYEQVSQLDIQRWALFFLISTGRGRALTEITPAQSERFLNWLYTKSQLAPFAIKTTEAHHFRRIAFLHMQAAGLSEQEILKNSIGRGFGIRDGNGILFISHVGQIYPSGFLPIPTGNIIGASLVEVYRDHPLFKSLRNVESLNGKCGICPFRWICGGSRARAYAATGDPLESDHLCPYQPHTKVAQGVLTHN